MTPAAAVLTAIAGDLADAARVLRQAVGNGDMGAVWCAVAAVERAGHLADAAASALGAAPLQEPGAWLHGSAVRAALEQLGARDA
jgi:hypothetical protein